MKEKEKVYKAIWISDPHFTHEENVLGHDPRVRLQAAIDHINQYHADARYCIISGDMVNRGTSADYNALRIRLDELAIPFLPMVGNHDDRDLFRSCLPVPGSCMKNFIQYTVPEQDCLVVCIDTQKKGSDAGEFCSERLEWLQTVLQNARGTPVYIFMHHPPMRLGLPMQDSENMHDGEAFLDLVSQYNCVKYLFIGHVHRPISGTVREIPFATMRSILYQAPAPRPEWSWETFKPSEEPPNIGVVTIGDNSVNLQYEQFCEFSCGATN